MAEQLRAGPMTVEKMTVSYVHSHGAPTREAGGLIPYVSILATMQITHMLDLVSSTVVNVTIHNQRRQYALLGPSHN